MSIHAKWLVAALLAVLAVAVFLRTHRLDWGLPAYYVPDEAVFIVDGLPSLDVERYEAKHFIYPHFHRYLVTAVTRMLGAGDGDVAGQVRVGRWINAVLGVATVLLTFAIAYLLLSPGTALASAAFVALAPYHASYGHVNGADTAMVFWISVAVCLAARGVRSERAGWLIAGGLAAGLAGATKYPGLAAVLPPAWVALTRGFGRDVWPQKRQLVLAAAVGVAGAIGFAAGSPLSVIEWRTCLEGIAFVREANYVLGASAPLPEAGWLAFPYWYQLVVVLPFSLGLALCLLAYLGLPWMTRREPRAALLLLSFVVPYFAIVGSSKATFPRYYLPMLPFLCIAAGYMADRLLAGRGWRRALGAAAVAVVVAYTAVVAHGRIDILSFEGRERAADWLATQIRARGGAPEDPTLIARSAISRRYDGLDPLLEGLPTLRIIGFWPSERRLRRDEPDFVVVSTPDRVRWGRGELEDAHTFFAKLDAGDLGYRLAYEVPAPTFTDAALFEQLEPLLVHAWTNGGIGLRIYEREPVALRPGREGGPAPPLDRDG